MTVGELRNALKDYESDMSVGIEIECAMTNVCKCINAKTLHVSKAYIGSSDERGNGLKYMDGDHCVVLSTTDNPVDWLAPNCVEIM